MGLLSGAVTLVAAIGWLLLANRGGQSPVTPDRLAAARTRWDESAPPSYNIEIEVTGPRPGVYRVEVRDGEPVAATLNGRSLVRRRTFGTWSAPGMFATIERDLERREQVESERAERGASQLALFGEFDERRGYPTHYHRIEWGGRGGGVDIEVKWRVRKFEVVRD